jgi:hypothetical protein
MPNTAIITTNNKHIPTVGMINKNCVAYLK